MQTQDTLKFADLLLSEVPFADLTEAAFARNPDFGGPPVTKEIDYRRLKVSVGNCPVSWRLRSFLKKTGKVLPQGMKLYHNWDVWMIAHAVAVDDRGEFTTLLSSEVDAIGYEAEFDPALAATVGLLPEPAVVRNVGGDLEVVANLGVDGSVASPQINEDMLGEMVLPMSGGAKLKFSTKADFVGRLSFGIWTPQVVATGLFSSKCAWLFYRKDAPLRNSQVMFQTVLVPAGIDELQFKCRSYALIRSVSFIPIPSRFETEWLELSTRPIGEI